MCRGGCVRRLSEGKHVRLDIDRVLAASECAVALARLLWSEKAGAAQHEKGAGRRAPRKTERVGELAD